MTEKLKKIVSDYTKIPADQLQSETQIGRSVINNSIVLHRMYAAIAKEGFEIQGYQEITTFGEIINKTSGIEASENSGNNHLKVISDPINVSHQSPGIGIDIEEISKMPKVTDFREDAFYTMNFAPAEIAYCILQPDQYASFAGLFAAKEAIVKADNRYKTINFNNIIVDHLPGGQPAFNGFKVSISHVKDLAVAVAIKVVDFNTPEVSNQKEMVINNTSRSSLLISVIAIVIALIAICMMLFK